MEYTTLGRTGVQVSRLCFGTMSFGDIADADMSGRMFEPLSGHRHQLLRLCQHVCRRPLRGDPGGAHQAGARRDCPDDQGLLARIRWAQRQGIVRRHILMQVENSLRRLDTDRIDLYFVHHFDPFTPIHEVLRSLDLLVQQGKIRYAGVSNWAAWQIALSLGESARLDLTRFECIQPMYSLLKRQAEVEILPLAQDQGLGVIPYSPMAGGILSGKYRWDDRPAESRLAVNTMYQARYGEEHYFDNRHPVCGPGRGTGRVGAGAGGGLGRPPFRCDRTHHRRPQPGAAQFIPGST